MSDTTTNWSCSDDAMVESAIRRGASRRDLLKRSEEHTSELQSQSNLVCRLLLEKNKTAIHMLADLQPPHQNPQRGRPALRRLLVSHLPRRRLHEPALLGALSPPMRRHRLLCHAE